MADISLTNLLTFGISKTEARMNLFQVKLSSEFLNNFCSESWRDHGKCVIMSEKPSSVKDKMYESSRLLSGLDNVTQTITIFKFTLIPGLKYIKFKE